ncbi:MAG: efflux RND transporter permease subunit [Chthoniobacterales bacterium]
MIRKLASSGAHWWMLVITAGLFVLVAAVVDLKPVVNEHFFFSSRDAAVRQSDKVGKRFSKTPGLILAVSSHDISSPEYLSRIGRLTHEIRAIDEVTSVKSLTSGPKNFEDAMESPFWHRLLIAHDRRSSNLIVFVTGRRSQELIHQLEQIIDRLDQRDFRIHMAGTPYVVEMIRRNLVHDFRCFSLAALLLFGLTMAMMFRSLRLFLGMLATCSSAVLLTLFLQSLLGHRIGILTVNLGTIVFIIALSHLVYMTFNWQTLARRQAKASSSLAQAARRMTLPPSFWSMMCASLGFGSLLMVRAQPLRELGFGGVLGAVVAFVCAYLMYPPFLAWAVPHKTAVVALEPPRGFWTHRFAVPSLAVLLLAALLGFGLTRIDTDPSLLDYFKPGSDLRDDLEYVDRNGGVSPLTIVVSADNDSPLDTDEAYRKMWSLQKALERDPNVGTVVSLPVLLAEGDRTPFSFFFSYKTLLRFMDKPEHGRIARSFVSRDRTQAVFLLRMIETHRDQTRLEVIGHLRGIVHKEGFKPVLVGGIYYLQGRLAQLVASSLVTGLFWLNLLFIGIAWFVARSVRVALAMIFSLTLVPICMLGGIGWLHIPMDIISAPATNVCIGIAIDSMIHLVFGVRRAQRDGKHGWAAWVAGRQEQWRGIVYSDVIFAAGFALFALSAFPPTQRFGLVVLAGLVVDLLANLLVLPLLGGAGWKKSKVQSPA